MATKYQKDINYNVDGKESAKGWLMFFATLEGRKYDLSSNADVSRNTTGSLNLKVTLNGDTYVLHNCDSGLNKNYASAKFKQDIGVGNAYNAYDAIAIAKAAGYTDKQIADALAYTFQGTNVSIKDTKLAYADERMVRQWNQQTTKATEQIKEYVAKQYGIKDPNVEVHLRQDGEGYEYYITYEQSSGTKDYIPVTNPEKDAQSFTEKGLSKAFADGTETDAGMQNYIARQQQVTNSEKGINAIDQALGIGVYSSENAQRAKQEAAKHGVSIDISNSGGTFNSGNDAVADIAKVPDASDKILANQIHNSPWLKNLITDIAKTDTNSVKGASLEEYLINALSQNDSVNKQTDTKIKSKSDATLSAIQNDTELYKAITSALQSSDPTGRKAASILATAQESNKTYKQSADELNEKLGGADAESLTAQQRAALFDNLSGRFNDYTSQQINQMLGDLRNETNAADAMNLIASMIVSGIEAENQKMSRKANDSEADADSNTAMSITANNALAEDSKVSSETLQQIINQYLGDNVDIDEITKQLTDTNSKFDLSNVKNTVFDRVKYNKEKELAEIQQDPQVAKILSEEYYNKVMRDKSAIDLSDEYGIGYLLNEAYRNNPTDKTIDASTDFVDYYTAFADEANASADKTFNAAQKAYLSAIAAGDTKVVAQLTKLADTAGVPQRNLHNASALAAQFSQQRQNSNVANAQAQDRAMQAAANKQMLSDAVAAGRQSWNTFMGDGNENGTGLRAGQYISDKNRNIYAKGYADMFSAGMASASNTNDNISEVNNTNKNNAAAAYANNAEQSIKIHNAKKGLYAAREALNQVAKNGV